MKDLLDEEARYRSGMYVTEIDKVVASCVRLIFPNTDDKWIWLEVRRNS